MKDKLLKLAERCEQATGPSAAERQLVIDAYNLIFPHELTLSEEEKGDDETRYQRTMHRVRFGTYINTDYERASLDAAMMLVPEGLSTTLVICPNRSTASLGTERGSIGDVNGYRAATHALALCAASLRARSSETKGE